MNKAFDVLNKSLFNNQLPKIDVQCLTTSQIQEIFDMHKHRRNAADLYAVYFPLPDLKKITFTKKNQLPSKHYLIINVSRIKGDYPNFSFIVNALCHEMIHYLDTIEGDLLFQFKTKFDAKDLKSFDEHKTDMFMKKSKQFNANGMTIIPDDGGYSQEQLNDFSSMRMRKLQEMKDTLINTQRSKSHIVATDLGDGIFAISF